MPLGGLGEGKKRKRRRRGRDIKNLGKRLQNEIY